MPPKAPAKAISESTMEALLVIIKREDKEQLKKFLKKEKISINDLDENGMNALHHLAADKEDTTKSMELVLSIGTEPNIPSAPGETALHLVVAPPTSKNWQEKIKILLQAGADINALYGDNWSALHTAAISGDSEHIEFLLANNINPSLTDKKGKTAIEYIIDKQNDSSLSLIRFHLFHGTALPAWNTDENPNQGLKRERISKDKMDELLREYQGHLESPISNPKEVARLKDANPWASLLKEWPEKPVNVANLDSAVNGTVPLRLNTINVMPYKNTSQEID